MTKYTYFPKRVKVIEVIDDWMSGTGNKTRHFKGYKWIIGKYYIAEHSNTYPLKKGDCFIIKEIWDKYGR